MGKVQIVGIGPGNFENMTIRADRALAACDVIVGYPVYVDLVKDRYPGKELLATPMTQEAKRCRMALELAAAGKTLAMAHTTVALDLGQTLDVKRDVTAQVAFHLVALFEFLTDFVQFFSGEIIDAASPVDARSVKNFQGRYTADAVDVSQRDVRALASGQVNTSYSGHSLSPEG